MINWRFHIDQKHIRSFISYFYIGEGKTTERNPITIHINLLESSKYQATKVNIIITRLCLVVKPPSKKLCMKNKHKC